VIFVWTIRDICEYFSPLLQIHLIHRKGHVEWISDALVPVLYSAPPSIAVQIRLFVTGANSRDYDDVEKITEHSSDKSVMKVLNSPLLRVRRGRPDLYGIITEQIAGAGGDISVNGTNAANLQLVVSMTELPVCGPETMTNGVRTALSDPRPLDILKGGPNVSLHIESFSFVSIEFPLKHDAD
jgi:ferric-chelate reductase